MRTLRAGRAPGARAGPTALAASPTSSARSAIRTSSATAMAGVTAVIHAATLHKPHVATHSRQAFIDTNVTGTLTLLEAAARAGVGAFVYTSTTSAFGSALTPGPGEPAAWITEEVVPVPRNIYGVTKVAAESLCELFHRADGAAGEWCCAPRASSRRTGRPGRQRRLPAGERAGQRAALPPRRHRGRGRRAPAGAKERAPAIGFGRYIVSATTPFLPDDLAELRADAPAVVRRLFPDRRSRLRGAELAAVPQPRPGLRQRPRPRPSCGWRPTYDFRRSSLDAARTSAASWRGGGQQGYDR